MIYCKCYIIGQHQTTNKNICREFCDYFQKLFTRKPELSSAQFNTCLADFRCFEEMKVAWCKGAHYKRCSSASAEKSWKTDKTPGIDGLAYKGTWGYHTCLSPCWWWSIKTLLYSKCFTRGIVKFLYKNKCGGNGITNFQPLTMLNTNLNILVKILADHLLTALPSLINPVKGRTIQNSFYLVHTIIEKVNSNVALINLGQSKPFDRVDHSFLEAVLSAAGFRVHFHSLLYASSQGHDGGKWEKIKTLHFVYQFITFHMTQMHNFHSPFTEHREKKSLSLLQNFNFNLVLKKS